MDTLSECPDCTGGRVVPELAGTYRVCVRCDGAGVIREAPADAY